MFAAIDVECAAIGRGHFDLYPCRIALVDFYGKILFNDICKVPKIAHPLTDLRV